MWAWVSGANTVDEIGVYGTIGMQSSNNFPGARDRSVAWIDSNNNLWLFGGLGYDSTGSNGPNGELNDLWEFNPVSKTWTCVGGSSTVGNSGLGQPGIYGTQGVPSTNNVPGGRYLAVSWKDSSGNFWLFGGHGSSSAGGQDQMNDLWKFDPVAKTWTWVQGSNVNEFVGTYGTQGTASPNNVPGPREDAISWADSSGNLWLFGGQGFDANSQAGFLNDLWKFDINAGTWTWVSGSNTLGAGTLGQIGIYGTQGAPAASNAPGGRSGTVSWMDSSGNLWLFGGQGFASSSAESYLNDLWRYTP
jgi:N-acetylneuraminic acid mutarotase